MSFLLGALASIAFLLKGRVYILVAESEAEMKKWQTYVENFLASHASVEEPVIEEPSLLDLISGKGSCLIAASVLLSPFLIVVIQ